MISASFYIAVCSAKNRLLRRLKRLREPRYLIGAVVGLGYFYFAVFAPRRRPGIRARNGRPPGTAPAFPIFQLASAPVVGLGVFLLAAIAWFLPAQSGLLDFSEAERAFLFTAPVSRRQLLVHRIVRSQIGSLIASSFIALFATPVSGAARIRFALGFWILLVTIRIYYGAVTLTRARLRSGVPGVRRVAWVPIGLMLAAVAVVAVSVARELRLASPTFTDVAVHLARATASGLPHVVLWPFIAILRPPFAGSTAAFAAAMGPSLLVLAAVTAWMLASDATFDAVAGQGGGASAHVEPQAAVVRARARSVGWTLALTGRPDVALLWKGAMATIRGLNGKTWRYAAPALFGVSGISFGVMQANRMQGPAAAVCVVSTIVAFAAVLLGPQIARLDLRTDFEHLDLLKTWPIRAGDVIRGEMAWPVLIVSAMMWAGVLVAALFSSPALPTVPFVSRWSFAIAAAFAGPALIAAQFAVHNTATIFFPAWVQLGRQRTRGVDAMGQRLIMLAAIVVSLALFALPGALAGGVIWLLLHRLAGDVVFVPAAIVFAGIVLVEVLAVTELLGPAYERIDLTSIERAE